jgi:hypothetical protein
MTLSEKSRAVSDSQVFFTGDLIFIKAGIIYFIRLLVYLALGDVFKDKTKLNPDPYQPSHDTFI